jgi:transposase-like protein
MAYSKDLKERAIEYRQKGHTVRETCKAYKISATALKKWMRLFSAGETLEIKKRVRESSVYPCEKICAYIEANPQATLSEVAERFGGSISGANKALQRSKITLKKRRRNT